jgi:predicted regulator of Ras-like GTPase activity (Roadblock/LC7/MglB family)
MASNELLQESIRRSGTEKWSGKLQIFLGESLIGQILFSEGNIVWATSKNQPETLGTFLWRLGHITRMQLEMIRKIFEANQGKKKFAEILEELGFMAAPVLRRCLLLHTRAAVRALLSCSEGVVKTAPGPRDPTQEMMFSVEEVLPFERSVGREATLEPGSRDPMVWILKSPQNEILHPLTVVPDYIASAVFSSDGDVLTAHISPDSIDPVLLGVVLVSMMENASRTIASTNLGMLDFLIISCSEGWLMMRWIDDKKEFLLTLMVGHLCNPTLAQYEITKNLSALRRWADNQSKLPFFKDLLRNAVTEEEQVQTLRLAIREQLQKLRREGCTDQTAKPLEDILDLLRNNNLKDAMNALMQADRTTLDKLMGKS